MRTRARALAALGAVLLGACGRGDADTRAEVRERVPAERAESPGDVVITNADRSMQLGLTGDTVWLGLSDSVRTIARSSMDSSAKGQGGLGGEIARIVTGTVDRALGTKVAYGLDEIEDVRYDRGLIVFRYRSGQHTLSFESIKAKERPVLETFAPADAERFVAAVRAARARRQRQL